MKVLQKHLLFLSERSMRSGNVVKKLGLSGHDFEEIKAAVREAESRTSGEIALAVASESSSYAFWELIASILTAGVMFLCLLPASSQIYEWMSGLFWDVKPWFLLVFYAVACGIVVFALYFLYNIPALDSLVIPYAAKNKAVTDRAFRYFSESGVYCTENHSGILIFVSYLERQVRIIADKGISVKISQDLWNLVADELTDCIAAGRAKDGFLGAVKKCGELLADNFPAQNENPDELSDGLAILEDEKWV